MMDLAQQYEARFERVLLPLAHAIEGQLVEYLKGHPRIDRVSARAKAIDRFLAKAAKSEDGKPKYDEPIHQIQDQVGGRIVTFYTSDVAPISDIVNRYYRPIETKKLIPDSEWKFGYFGLHFILLVPSDLIDPDWPSELVPEFFELQVKTLFQHAWSEAQHDLGYKVGGRALTPSDERKMAFTAAQAWGADQIFDDLFRDLSVD